MSKLFGDSVFMMTFLSNSLKFSLKLRPWEEVNLHTKYSYTVLCTDIHKERRKPRSPMVMDEEFRRRVRMLQ